MKPICYSRSPDVRATFVRRHLARLAGTVTDVVYLVPRKFLDDAQGRLGDVPHVRFFAYEDITKSNEVFNRATDNTLLVLDRAARYKMITTDTFVRLSRASSLYPQRILIDTVPFVSDVQFLYCPLALIDRTILNYQHWYSFRENNLEALPDGREVRAFDTALLARKLAPYVELDYDAFLARPWDAVACPLTPAERSEYQALRDELFATRTNASPIITMLADWVNIRPSRYAALQATLAAATGPVVVYTNLTGHNRRLQKVIPGVEVKTFYDANGDEDRYQTIILAELPIARRYLFLDVLANIRPDCRVVILRSDTTVDTLLYNYLQGEIMGINALTSAIAAERLVMA